MASRAILRRKRFVSEYLNGSVRTIQSLECVGRPLGFQWDNSRSFLTDAEDFQRGNDVDNYLVFKGNCSSCYTHEGLRNDKYKRLLTGSGIKQQEMCFPVASRWFYQSVRNASTATAGQPDFDSDDDENEKLAAKKRKEASPEDCDEAAVGLTSAKAKAREKKSHISQKAERSILQRAWALVLGIGPALRAVAAMNREDWAKKLVHWKGEVVSTLKHYWLGFKLLWVDVRISSRLLVKLVGGKSLTRRERQQLTRTTADIFRLVPFAVFIIVPFMEFLLPVFLKLFPNMLPSTFQDKMKEEEALKRKLKARMEYAKFLQDTIKEMAKEVQNSRTGEVKKTAKDLDDFMSRVRKGARVANEEILGFAKLFNDELTLDNISRPRLLSMCKYMGISSYGTDAYLRYMLRKRLQRIKDDDKLIQAEGVKSLSESELREECRERGMLGMRSVEEMREQLRDWLDLSLNHSVPSSLLILSRSFTISGKLRPEEAVRDTLSSLPDEVVDTVGVTTLPSEDPLSERIRKLEFLEMQDELIKEEEKKAREEAKKATKTEPVADQEDLALKEMTDRTEKIENKQTRQRVSEEQDGLCVLSRALAVLASASSVSREREEFLRLAKNEIELYNSIVEKEGAGAVGEKEAFKAYMAAKEENDSTNEANDNDDVSSALIDRVEAMLQNLEKEIDDVDNKIGNHWRLLDRDSDGKVTPEEVAAAAMYLRETISKDGVQQLISQLKKDKDGKILVEDIVRLGSQGEDIDAADDIRI